MEITLPGYSGRLAGAVMTVSATASIPALPSVLDLAVGVGLAEGVVGVLLALFTTARLAVGVTLCLRDRDDNDCDRGHDVPEVLALPDVPAMPDVVCGDAHDARSPGATTYAPIPAR